MYTDFRFALRQLSKNPGFTVVAVLTLALGIGANTALFSLIHHLLLKSLPVKDPSSLVLLEVQQPKQRFPLFTHSVYLDLRGRSEIFRDVIAFMTRPVGGVVQRSAERLQVEVVSGNYFQALGVHPILGRLLADHDDQAPGAHPVAVLSYHYWQRRFGGNPDVIGEVIRLSGHPFTIVGVSQPQFFGLRVGESPDVRVPLMMEAQTKTAPTWLYDSEIRWLRLMAYVKPGVSRAEAQSAAAVFFQQAQSARSKGQRDSEQLVLEAGHRGASSLRSQFGASLWVTFVLVGIVLLITCANVANLLLTRAAARTREVAVRLALGAGRRRLLRQFLTENLLLCAVGGVLGLILAPWLASLLVGLLPDSDASRHLETSINAEILIFTVAISLFTGLLFGLAPAWRCSRVALVEGLKVSPSGFAGPHGERWNCTLVSVQVALSVVVLVAAGLFARTLWNLHRVDAGFSRQQLLLASVDPSSKGWRGQQIFQFYQELLKRVEALPGVRSASLARIRLLAGGGVSDSLTIRGYQPQPGENMNVLINAVSPKYFGTLGIPFQVGRDFAGTDDPASPGVAIMNEMAARRFFPGEDPIGKIIQVGNPVDLRIVGVVQDSKYGDLRDRIESTVYVSALQRPDAAWRSTLYLRVSGSTVSLLASLQSTVSSLAPDLPLFAVRTMDAEVGSLLARERMLAWLSASFGLVALVLAAIGVYGVLAYAISRSTREIGIRMALGAQRRTVLALVLGRGLKLAGAGIVLGLMGAMASTRLLRSLLFGVGPTDPLTFVVVPLLLVFVALLACWLPARRAANVDPMAALRCE